MLYWLDVLLLNKSEVAGIKGDIAKILAAVTKQ